jgi:hypothetical protein
MSMKTIELPAYTRRVFLNRTLQALGAVAAMPLAGSLAESAVAESGEAGASGPTTAVPELQFLNADEYRVLDAVSDTLIPHGGAFDLGARDVGLAGRIDRYLLKMDPAVAQGFRGALAFVEQKTPEMAGKAAPFSRLSEDDRTAVCNAMLRAGGLPAGVLLAMKYVNMSHFYTLDQTWKFTGYDGPMLLEETR